MAQMSRRCSAGKSVPAHDKHHVAGWLRPSEGLILEMKLDSEYKMNDSVFGGC